MSGAAFKTTPCRGCGKPIIFARLANGTTVPLDPKPATYYLTRDDDGVVHALRANDKDADDPVFTTHFATCPKADDFSRGRQADETQDADPASGP